MCKIIIYDNNHNMKCKILQAILLQVYTLKMGLLEKNAPIVICNIPPIVGIYYIVD